MATKYWRVETLATNGWNITDPRLDVKLLKDQAKVRLEELIAEGYNPNRLRAIPDATQRGEKRPKI